MFHVRFSRCAGALAAVAVLATSSTAYASPDAVPVRLGSWGLDLAAMDTAIDPADDFAGYASGTWVGATTIPAGRFVTGPISDALARVRANVQTVVESSESRRTAEALQIAAFRQSYLDVEEIERRGDAPFRAMLDSLEVADRAELANHLGTSALYSPLIAPRFGPDPDAPSRTAVFLWLDGLSIEKARYAAPEQTEIRAEFVRYVDAMLAAAAWPVSGMGESVLAFETELAALHWSDIDRDDRLKTNNPMTLVELQRHAPEFPWSEFVQAAGLGNIDRYIVAERSAMPAFAALFGDTDLDVMRAWVAFRALDASASYLPRAFREARFEFRGRILAGQQTPAPRSATAVVQNLLSDPLSSEYALLFSRPEMIADVELIVEDLRAAMATRIQTADWLDGPTREAAVAKLQAMRFRIGAAPVETVKLDVELDPQDAYGNFTRLNRAQWARLIDRLSPDYQAGEAWEQRPYILSLAAKLEQNVVYIPTAVLQAPYYQVGADPAVNYGAIGSAIGHEITHHFDSRGRRYDPQGRLTDWWTPQASVAFEQRVASFSEYLDGLSFVGVPLTGRRIVDESIADVGGIQLAIDAYRARYGDQGAPLNGLQPMQRLMLAWAQVQRNKALPEVDAEAPSVVPYLPGRMRAEEPLRHIEAWYTAFQVDPEDDLYLPVDRRLHLW